MRPVNIVLSAVVALGAGCATDLAKRAGLAEATPGFQELRIHAYGMQRVPANPLDPTGLSSDVSERLDGVACTLGNDRGSWEMVAPGKVTVALSTGKLAVECRKEGYRTASGAIPCVTPKARATAGGAHVGLMIIQSAGPALIYAAPAAILLGGAAVVGGGAAAGSAMASGPGARICDYSPSGELAFHLWKEAR